VHFGYQEVDAAANNAAVTIFRLLVVEKLDMSFCCGLQMNQSTYLRVPWSVTSLE
jgi:hypothetical protein